MKTKIVINFFSIICFFLLGASSKFNQKSIDLDLNPNTQLVKQSHHSHPEIEGFSYCFGYEDLMQKDETTGYFTYNTDFFYSPFTSTSNLYILRVQASFTPGYTGNQNGNTYYDPNYLLWKGYIHSKSYQVTKNGKTSSKIHYVASWPKSSVSSVTVTKETSFSLGFLSGREIGLTYNLSTGAVGLNLTLNNSSSVTFGFSKSISITEPNPTLSHQISNNEAQWNFQYIESSSVTYDLDTYFMFEAEKSNSGFQDFSFGYSVKINLTCVAWENYLWRQERNTTLEIDDGEFGLY